MLAVEKTIPKVEAQVSAHSEQEIPVAHHVPDPWEHPTIGFVQKIQKWGNLKTRFFWSKVEKSWERTAILELIIIIVNSVIISVSVYQIHPNPLVHCAARIWIKIATSQDLTVLFLSCALTGLYRSQRHPQLSPKCLFTQFEDGWSITHTGSMYGIYIYTNIKGVYWWDPCYHIYIAYMDPMGNYIASRNEATHGLRPLPSHLLRIAVRKEGGAKGEEIRQHGPDEATGVAVDLKTPLGEGPLGWFSDQC